MKLIVVNLRLSLFRWILLAACLLLLPFGLRAESRQQAQSAATGAAAGLVQIQATNVTGDAATVSVSIPGLADNLKIHLNGQDVSKRFSSLDCNGATCKTATLTRTDGFRAQKNVLTVVANGGKTGRLRFDAMTSTAAPARSSLPQFRGMSATPKAQSLGSSFATYLPPTVAFTTNHPGGWQANSPWITINSVSYPDVAPGGTCQGAIYLAVVLDRQTLEEKTSAPESSPMCLANSGAVKNYLSSLGTNDIVILGSNSGIAPDAGLDLTAMGGVAFSGSPGDEFYPSSIIAIGTPGAAQNTAYEGYYSNAPGHEPINVFANGILQEDAYGNYNFESSDVVQFTVSPNDPGVLTTSTGSSAIAISIPNAPANSPLQYVYTPPQGVGGYWLLVLSRTSLATYPQYCPRGNISSDGTTQYIPNCGIFYPTGSSDAATAMAAYKSLASALNAVNPWQIAFLTTVGQAANVGGSCGDTCLWYVGGFNGATNDSNNSSNGFYEFSQALSALGGTPNLNQSLLSPTSAYTFVGAPGIGGPLTGNGVESTTVLSSQMQTGFVHGIMRRNLNGLYMPHQTNQEPAALYAAKGGVHDSEFKLTEVALQQPVEWPSSSMTTLLPGANTLAGQVAAYRYMSYTLLHSFYMRGVSQVGAAHLDDLHYFFTGSFNTMVDYHNYDPQDMAFPDPNYSSGLYVYDCDAVSPVTLVNGNSGKQCAFNYFAVDSQPLMFTDADFYAVQAQLHNEVIYLTNSLQFLITGPNSMKSVIVSSSSNVGLALTNAAANVLGSSLQPVPPQTVVSTSWQNIVSMIGGVASMLSAVPGLGEIAGVASLATTGAKIAGGIASAVGGAASLSGAAGEITSSTSTNVLPSAYAKFSNTVANLSNGYLQDQLSGGFDAMADSLTSDWGRLSTIGPLTIDPTNTVFFAPSYTAESIAVNTLTQAASRNFYLALMPAMGYNIDYYPGVRGYVHQSATIGSQNIPDMGVSRTSGNVELCSAYYLSPQENSETGPGNVGGGVPHTYVWYPTIGGSPTPFANNHAGIPDTDSTSIDMYVIGGKVSYPGTSTPVIQVPSAQLATYLFTNAGLNLPIDEFVTANGPMQSSFTNMSAGSTNRAKNSNASICPAQFYPVAEEAVHVGGGQDNTATTTSTTLSIPPTSILGDDLPVSATVLAGSTPVTAGSVYFIVDGTGSVNGTLNAQGVASINIPSALLTRGPHQIVAKYSMIAPYQASMSSAATMNVYTTAPDINLSASTNTTTVSYGSVSSPITLQLTSISGLTGPVNLTCSGLPVAMSCAFNPPQLTLTANGQATASFVINGGSVSRSSFWIPGIGLLLLPVSLASLSRIRKGALRISGLVCLVLLTLLGASSLSGCSGRGSSSSSNAFRESGTKTVIINVTSGAVTRTIPIQVTIQ